MKNLIIETPVEAEDENDKGLFETMVDSYRGRLFLMVMAISGLAVMTLMNGDVFSFVAIILAMMTTLCFLYFIVTYYTELHLLDVWHDLICLKQD